LASHGHFFVAEGFNRVHAWRKIEDAIGGRRADVILGKDNFEDVQPRIGRNGLHYPSALWFDVSYLWVGEVKFSERLLRFGRKSLLESRRGAGGDHASGADVDGRLRRTHQRGDE
jgi:hypothetical protein